VAGRTQWYNAGAGGTRSTKSHRARIVDKVSRRWSPGVWDRGVI
jgi:hypothetical protein